MKLFNVYIVLIVCVISGILAPAAGRVSADDGNGKLTVDWSVKICDSILSRSTPETFGPWDYNEGLVIEGMWRVYKRTGDTRYYNFVKSWVDRYLVKESYTEIEIEIVEGEEGPEEVEKEITIDVGLSPDIMLNRLDYMMPGVLLCHLYEETGESYYKIAARQIRDSIDTYTRTSDGGLVLSESETTRVLALDGTFMLSIFLINYGDVFKDEAYAIDECIDQLIIHNNRLKDSETGLARQAWDENGAATWADPETYLSPEIWCRGVGWYVVACTEVLEKLPSDHPERQNLIGILVDYLDNLKRYQDDITGLWYQVVDKGHLPDNWLEESSTCLYIYAMNKAIDNGYISLEDYDTTLRKAFEGALSNIELTSMGKTNLYGTCTGTGPGSPYSYYIDRTQPVNDKHGLGAFLFAYETMRTKYSDIKHIYQAEEGYKSQVATRTDYRGWTGKSYVDFKEELGSFLQLVVSSPITGFTTMEIRYSNSDDTDKPLELSVNGEVIKDYIPFLPTEAWSVWDLQSISISLDEGENIIRLKSTTASGGPNIDWIAFETPVYINEPPIVTDIPDNVIYVGGNFSEIHLDDYVSDIDDTHEEITWTYSGNTDLTVNIDENHIATVALPEDPWIGSETVTFRATDPDAFSAETEATFAVLTKGQFTVSSLNISPDQVYLGETVQISARIDNSGLKESIYQVLCRINGVIKATDNITLARGTGKIVEFNVLIEEAGDTEIDVNGLSSVISVKDYARDSEVTLDVPIPNGNGESDSSSGYWRLILLMVVIVAIPVVGIVYLVKKKKI